MKIIRQQNGTELTLALEGRLDSNTAPELEKALKDSLAGCDRLTLDFARLNYISSAGLRVLLSASRRLKAPVTVREVTPEVYDILDMTGFTTLLNVERRLRELSVEGCDVIGTGAIGTVYRIDADTIVKVYNVPDALEMIRNEQRRAKQAFLKGVPTAISYDAVRVGDRYGSVFELVDAQTYNDLLVAHPEDADDILRRYAGIIRQVHAIEAEPGELPDCRDIYLRYIDALEGVLPAALSDRLRALIGAMPEDLRLVHGDFHMKNIMQTADETLLIDMDTLSVGNPVFDFAGIYVAYRGFNAHEPDNSERFLSISDDMSRRIWDTTVKLCLDAPDDKALQEKLERIAVVSGMRFLYLLVVLRLGTEALREVRIRDTVKSLETLAEKVSDLTI